MQYLVAEQRAVVVVLLGRVPRHKHGRAVHDLGLHVSRRRRGRCLLGAGANTATRAAGDAVVVWRDVDLVTHRLLEVCEDVGGSGVLIDRHSSEVGALATPSFRHRTVLHVEAVDILEELVRNLNNIITM